MKSNKVIISGVLLLGASLSVFADGNKPPSTPSSSVFGLATSLTHGNGATGGSCTIFNAGDAAVTVTDLHAEDGAGNALASNSADTTLCGGKPVASRQSCSVDFVTTGGAACLAVFSVASSTPPKSDAPKPPTTQPSVKMALELSDGAGNVLSHVDATAITPPASKPSNGGGN